MSRPEADRVAQLYDEKAPLYDEHYRRPVDLAEDDVLYGWLRPYLDRRFVFDVGCGTGQLLKHASVDGYIGIDVSAAMLYEARKCTLPHVDFLQQDICALADRGLFDTTAQLFHTAVSLWAFPHFSDQQLALDRMARSVRRGGHVVVQGFARRYVERPNYILNGQGADLLQPTTPESLGAMAGLAGLEVVEIKGFRYALWVDHVPGLPRAVLARAFSLSSGRLPASLAATHVLIARRP